MLTFKKYRKYLSVLLLFLCSLFTMFAFQNCGQPINSQSAGSVAGVNTSSSTSPDPAPAPAPGLPTAPASAPAPAPSPTPMTTTSGGGTATILTPLSAAERATLCAPKIDTTSAVTMSLGVTDLTAVSGLATGSGDVNTNTTFNQTVNTGINTTDLTITVPKGRTTSPTTCTAQVDYTCDVPTDSAHLPFFTQAFSMNPASVDYGKNVAPTADPTKMNTIANNVINRTNCAGSANVAGPTYSRTVPVMQNIHNNNNGYRCVKGYYWIRLSAITTMESTLKTKTPGAADYKYIKITVNDGCWAETRLKSPVDLPRLSSMGAQLAMNDEWVAAVAPLDNTSPLVGDGAVYMFHDVNRNGNWSFHSRISMENAASGDTVSSAAIDGNILVLGSQNHNAKRGSAQVFAFNGSAWINTKVVLNPPNAQAQLFGASMAMSNSTLVVGAPSFSNTLGGNDLSGIAYVYRCSTAGCNPDYTISNPVPGAAFGSSVAMSGSRVAIGAPYAINITDRGDGFVKIYDVAGAAQPVGSLAPPVANKIPAGDDIPAGMRFGHSVAIYNLSVLVGAPNYNDNSTDRQFSGAAYYFANMGSTGLLLNTAPLNMANNGKSVAINSKGLYVGCPGCSAGEGVVRSYGFGGALNFTVFALNKLTNAGFGGAVRATDSYLSVGAPVMGDPNVNSGASYVFRLP